MVFGCTTEVVTRSSRALGGRRHGRSRRLEQKREKASRPPVGQSLAYSAVGFAGADAQTPGRRILRRWPLQRVPWGCLVLVCCSNRPRTRFSLAASTVSVRG